MPESLASGAAAFAPFPFSADQIAGILTPPPVLTEPAADLDLDRYRAARERVAADSLLGRLVFLARGRLGVHDPITRGLVALAIGPDELPRLDA